MQTFDIAVLMGDGISSEIIQEALRVLDVIEQRNSVKFNIQQVAFGAQAYFDYGDAFPEKTKKTCDHAHAILKGPVGLSHELTQKIPIDKQPERAAILPLRERYQTFANFRPVYLPKSLANFSPLKPEIIKEGIDIIMVRELVGGLYFGHKETGINQYNERYVNETLEYTDTQIHRVLVEAFKLSMSRKKILHNIHKSNVLKSSVLWNQVLEEVRVDFPQVKIIHMLVDAAATHLCLNPCQFDVMVMENMFGDILSDQGGGILGSLGLMPSACQGPEKSYYEPSHGSAPDIAGKGKANPYSMIGSVAMMLERSFNLKNEADNIWLAMQRIFSDGYTTADLTPISDVPKIISTQIFGDKVIANLNEHFCS